MIAFQFPLLIKGMQGHLIYLLHNVRKTDTIKVKFRLNDKQGCFS